MAGVAADQLQRTGVACKVPEGHVHRLATVCESYHQRRGRRQPREPFQPRAAGLVHKPCFFRLRSEDNKAASAGRLFWTLHLQAEQAGESDKGNGHGPDGQKNLQGGQRISLRHRDCLQ